MRETSTAVVRDRTPFTLGCTYFRKGPKFAECNRYGVANVPPGGGTLGNFICSLIAKFRDLFDKLNLDDIIFGICINVCAFSFLTLIIGLGVIAYYSPVTISDFTHKSKY